jgi:hypothetical protein
VLLRSGQTDHDVDTVSERFLSAVGVAGSPETAASRIIDHLDARADHVLVSAFGDLDSVVDQLEQLAPHSPTRSRAESHPKSFCTALLSMQRKCLLNGRRTTSCQRCDAHDADDQPDTGQHADDSNNGDH